MKKYSRSIKAVGFAFLCLVLFSGCSMVVHPITKSRNFASTGKLLIMPPHDVTQGGKAHPEGKGTGKRLQDSIERELKKALAYEIVVYEANDRFNFTTNIKIEDAIAESKKKDADYCLILSLGEFRHVFTLILVRGDFVNLDRAVLVDVNSGKEVWSLRKPLYSKQGSRHVIIDSFAEGIVKSITEKSTTE